jgi:hypothetical protein
MKSSATEKQHTSAARPVLIVFHSHADPPNDDTPDGGGDPDDSSSPPPTDPDISTSPMRADGLAEATGFAFMLQSGPSSDTLAAPPSAPAGYVVKVWIRDPVTRRWGLALSTQIPLRKWFSTHDYNGGDLYFQITGSTDDTNSRAVVHLVEL